MICACGFFIFGVHKITNQIMDEIVEFGGLFCKKLRWNGFLMLGSIICKRADFSTQIGMSSFRNKLWGRFEGCEVGGVIF